MGAKQVGSRRQPARATAGWNPGGRQAESNSHVRLASGALECISLADGQVKQAGTSIAGTVYGGG